MKKMKYIFNLVILLLVGHLATAQTYFLKMEVVSESSTALEVDIFVAGSSGFQLGSSNLVMTFDPAVLENPALTSHNLTEMSGVFTVYSDVTVTEPATGKASLNIVLSATGAGDAMALFPSYTNIARIKFDVLDASASKVIDWSYNGGTTETVMFLHDETTQIFTANALTDLTGLSGSLPIKLSAFEAAWKSIRSAFQIPRLVWVTETEIGASHFVVERSLDGHHWKKIGTVECKKTGIQYSFDDQDINSREVAKVYYRLKMTDLDGSFLYSNIESLIGNASLNEQETEIKVYPSIFSNQLNVSIPNVENNENLKVNFFNLQGKLERTFSIQKGMTHLDDMSRLQNGMYLAVIRQGDKLLKTVTLIKQQ